MICQASHHREGNSQSLVNASKIVVHGMDRNHSCMVPDLFRKAMVNLKSPGIEMISRLWETVGMSKKRTKADRAQRQADQLEKKASRRPVQNRKEKAPREDLSQAGVRIVEQPPRI